MSIVVVRRPERRPPPKPPRGEILLESPPEIPEVQSQGFAGVMTYLPMLAGGAAMGLMFTAGGNTNPVMYVASGLFALSMVGMTMGQLGRQAGERKSRLNGLRRDYFRYLSQVRKRVRRAAVQQREALEWSSPAPDSLWWIALGPRLWERRPRDDDFGTVRLGTGVQKLAIQLIPPDSKPVEDLDALSAGALRRFVRTHSTVPHLPVAVALHSFARIRLTGDPVAVRGLVRAMVAQMAVFHSPDDLRIMVCAGGEWMAQWDWVKWLPHALHPEETDAAGQARLMSGTLADLDRLVGEDLKERARFRPGASADALPYHVLIVDGGHIPHDSQLGADAIQGVTVIDLSGTAGAVEEKSTLRLDVRPDGFFMIKVDHAGKESSTRLGDPDRLDFLRAEGLARQLAPLRASTAKGGEEQDVLTANTSLTDLLGVGDPARLDPAVVWRPRAGRNRLRVPIGLGGDGRVVELDIKESAQGGMGPHGLVIGATGSGKSELLRTLVLGLAMTHSSEILNFVLVDFKGGATFLGLDSLSHVSAVITNLEDELPLVDRMHDALHGEMVRRQELLRAAGNYASLRDYERAREQGVPLQPLPTLFVVIDEFSELLAAKPEFVELFVMIGRLGRSLGVHLLLASQRLEEGRLRGLDTHLSYRVGLRTFSAMESRVVLGVADAYELPSAPGNGYLKFDTTGMTRFKAAYVSGPYQADPSHGTAGARGPVRQVVPYGPAFVPFPVVEEPAGRPEAEDGPPDGTGGEGGRDGRDAPSLLDVVVDRLRGQGPPAHRIWLPPLGEPPTLADLLPPLSVTPQLGLTTAGWAGRGRLHAVVGVVDKPFEQRSDPFWLDLSGAAGHVGVAGGTQSGKSTVLRTLITGMALTHTPREVQFYCLDFGGGSLASLEALPHVGGIATRLDGDRVRRTVAEIAALLQRRERDFAEQGIESIAAYRRQLADGTIQGDGWGDVFLVVDGWLTVRQEFETLEPVITDLAARGLGYGIHVVAATNKWSEFRPGIRDLFGTRVELKLGDAYESEVNRKASLAVPEGVPGRGLTKEGLHFLSAVPRIDGVHSAEDLPAGVRALVHAVRDAWQGPAAPGVRLLPAVLPAETLPGAEQTGHRIPIGIDEAALSPVLLDFDADPHFIVVGDTESGKSNLLRLVTEGLVARRTPQEAMMIVIDYRRSLLDSAATEHRIGYAASGAAALELVNDARGALLKRLPPANLTAEELRARSWWQGSDLYIVVEDYDLVATSSNPLLPLVDLIPQARDIGLHLVMSRAMGGVGRAMFDPVIQRIKDMATPAVILSGNKDEGTLFGNVRPHPLPPGRGYHTDRRHGARLVQTAFLAPQPPPEAG
ncbi:type VII secretion protein EccCa [Planomonospora parontospora]|uniref:type VII secretion protein EccCa n=1 Tax=Planomonospora parontospora TaxID=58119 RepID=UPI001670D95A|nr:type VII secretion protein EccCa [Planomonospora parontospora]GGL56149.1 type VII secretion protein EccC [Planomonospora parontospora subsp. antibiotica]GII19155.1 type VII secretion protein EccC [Planomonospora parontospora subsp. antibiotica]